MTQLNAWSVAPLPTSPNMTRSAKLEAAHLRSSSNARPHPLAHSLTRPLILSLTLSLLPCSLGALCMLSPSDARAESELETKGEIKGETKERTNTGVSSESAAPSKRDPRVPRGSANPARRLISGDQAKRERSSKREYRVIPQSRGFWGTFFFWLGGVVCMYLVGRRVFREQSHQRKTLKRLRDELGHFFPEFDPINITKWVGLAADHLYHSWREGDLSTMESFTTEDFIKAETQKIERDQLLSDTSGVTDQLHLVKILAVHTLGMTWRSTDDAPHPPKGVVLTLRVEAKELSYDASLDLEELKRAKKKPVQRQYIWRLVHAGKTWALDEVKVANDDLKNLGEALPLPPIAEWRRPDSGPEPTAESTSSQA